MSAPAGALHPGTRTSLERYYHWHAPIYDLTRWSFLFGRSALLRQLLIGPAPEHLLEVGCGTGRNLEQLAWQFPEARLTGVDLSEAMLTRAERRLRRYGTRVRCFHRRFAAPIPLDPPCDVVLFSYALTMMNPGWEQALAAAKELLPPGGRIAVVDFGGSRWTWFRRWMGRNHVRLDDHLLPRLQGGFRTEAVRVAQAYGGLWRYFLFLGRASGGLEAPPDREPDPAGAKSMATGAGDHQKSIR